MNLYHPLLAERARFRCFQGRKARVGEGRLADAKSLCGPENLVTKRVCPTTSFKHCGVFARFLIEG